MRFQLMLRYFKPEKKRELEWPENWTFPRLPCTERKKKG